MTNQKSKFSLTISILAIVFGIGFIFLRVPLIPSVEMEVVNEPSEVENIKVVNDLAELNIDNLADSISSQKGLTISLDGYFTEASKHFTADEFKAAFKSNETIIWGYDDGKGDPIEYTLRGLIEEYLMNKDFTVSDSIKVNELNHDSNSLFNADEFFEGGIEYFDYFVATEDESLADYEWASLILIFQNNELVGLAHRTWSI